MKDYKLRDLCSSHTLDFCSASEMRKIDKKRKRHMQKEKEKTFSLLFSPLRPEEIKLFSVRFRTSISTKPDGPGGKNIEMRAYQIGNRKEQIFIFF